ncbi:MAG: PilZ domain-containing protein [Candidatus Omnitrophota bacterium]|nr:PilZ domain-containing protein [Candidatus Omnitrophota bacterium]MDZ4241876.1 PilZ domain-containing protein [Candidatus Omnitrophota bacterium]
MMNFNKNGKNQESDQAERRKYKRIQKHFILSYFDLLDPQIRFDASQLKNISLGGMCFVTSRPFSPGTRLGIELKTPFLAELTYLEGVVLGSNEKLKNIIYETRLKFENLTPQAEFVINKLIQYFEKGDRESDE